MKRNVLVFILALAGAFCLGLWQGRRGTAEGTVADTVIVRDTVRDTITQWRTDTVPQFVAQVTVDTIWLPADTVPTMIPVVQRHFTDDSTYSAYVSGPQYAQWPRLDSISVSQRTITERITEHITVTRHRRWNVGITTGVGYGVTSRQPDLFVGVGLTYNPF